MHCAAMLKHSPGSSSVDGNSAGDASLLCRKHQIVSDACPGELLIAAVLVPGNKLDHSFYLSCLG